MAEEDFNVEMYDENDQDELNDTNMRQTLHSFNTLTRDSHPAVRQHLLQVARDSRANETGADKTVAIMAQARNLNGFNGAPGLDDMQRQAEQIPWGDEMKKQFQDNNFKVQQELNKFLGLMEYDNFKRQYNHDAKPLENYLRTISSKEYEIMMKNRRLDRLE